jgi:hypothetical protein
MNYDKNSNKSEYRGQQNFILKYIDYFHEFNKIG